MRARKQRRADGSKNLRGRAQQRTERLRCNLRERISGRAVFERLEEAVSMGACYTGGEKESQLEAS